jgi:hypothetical protein
MARRKCTPKAHPIPALVVTRSAIETKQLVYVLVADKKVRYPNGRSNIVYIGTTKKGLARVASSAAFRAVSILKTQGIKKLSAYILTYQGISGLQDMHKHLERAALVVFFLEYGGKPLANKQGTNIWSASKEFRFFNPRTLLKRLQQLGNLKQ